MSRIEKNWGQIIPLSSETKQTKWAVTIVCESCSRHGTLAAKDSGPGEKGNQDCLPLPCSTSRAQVGHRRRLSSQGSRGSQQILASIWGRKASQQTAGRSRKRTPQLGEKPFRRREGCAGARGAWGLKDSE